MKTLLVISFKISLVNFLVSCVFVLIVYFFDKNHVEIKGLSLFLAILSIIFFIVTVRRIGEEYIHRTDYTIFLTSSSILILSLFGLAFSLLLHGYIDPNLRYEEAHVSVDSLYETLSRFEREQNISFLFNYDEEIERVVSRYEPINIIRAKLISTLITLVFYNFLVLLTAFEKSE